MDAAPKPDTEAEPLTPPTAQRIAVQQDLFSPAAASDVVLSAFTAPTLTAAAAHLDSLSWMPWTPAERTVLAELRALALGEHQPGGPWGDDPALDSVRLRLLRDRVREDDEDPHGTWTRFFHWAADHLPLPLPRALPVSAVPAAVTAVAAARGPVAGYDALIARSRTPWTSRRLAPVASALALRCALDGLMRPTMAPALVPRPYGSRRRRARQRLAAVLAWEACRTTGQSAALVHLTAAIVAGDLRSVLPAHVSTEDVEPWLDAGYLAPALDALGDSDHFWRPTDQTPAGPGGPDTRAVVAALGRVVGDTPRAAALFLDPQLATAAVHALLGYGPSAHAIASAARPHPLLADAHAALARAIALGVKGAVDTIPAIPLSTDAKRILDRLRATPDPSLVLGSPWWLVADRGPLTSSLMREGRRNVATLMRAALDRPDMRADLEPFWVQSGSREDTASTVALARWLAQTVKLRPTAEQWRALLQAHGAQRLDQP